MLMEINVGYSELAFSGKISLMYCPIAFRKISWLNIAMKVTRNIFLTTFIFALIGCMGISAQLQKPAKDLSPALQSVKKPNPTPNEKLLAAAIEQVGITTEYDPAYAKLTFPNGDVPLKTGVCADVVVRSFRQVGIDLQKEINEDMKKSFAKYPQKWGAKSADASIDHRRVPNLMTWFERREKTQPLSTEAIDYQPGDVVAWDLGKGLTHIGLLSDVKTSDKNNYLIVHNIGAGAQLEDRLFAWKIIGHYRYFDSKEKSRSVPPAVTGEQ